ncbi:sensor histidine kinase [Algibacter sp. L4_22]|uniref:sensor histidine kinase n=1 Tax=Algibacter sp. L4_22 TaxID=2942477 RepID=UPI00201B7185|nr:histidine kinase [Algibacter sp. L4_22]MCL5130374.1 histidine kinase [Algibacter sp. L4_22]
MKRLILLALILISIPVIVISGSSRSQNLSNNYLDLPKDDKWEYVKERLFEGETQNFHSHSGPILIELVNSRSPDSTALESVFDELREVLPDKEIDYFRNYTGASSLRIPQSDDPKEVNGIKFSKLKGRALTLWITEVESKKEAYTLYDERFLKTASINYYGAKLVNSRTRGPRSNKRYKVTNSRQFTFKFHESQTVKERMEMIRFYLVRMLSCSSLFKERTNHEAEVVGAMLNSNKASSWHLDFTKYDKFLLQKFYSPTLLEDYRNYMFKTYPRWSADNLVDKENTKLLANWTRAIFAVVFFFLAFSLLYKRQYRFKFLSYFVPILIAYLCLIELNFVNSYFFPTGKPFNQEKFWFYLLVLFIIVVFIAFFLWLFDKCIAKKDMSFTTQLVLKTSFTLFVFLALAFLVPIILSDIEWNKIHYINWIKSYDYLVGFRSPVTWAFLFSLGRGAILYLDHFSENLVKQKDIELSTLKAANAQAEVRLLQSQINPHFLYNALNSIASLAQSDAVKTEKMALSLSDLFKYTINRKGKKNSTIGDEVEMVKNYLEVEQIRFGDRLSFNISVDESLEAIEIPMFLIQPIIENAVKHGISKIENNGEIELKIVRNNSDIVISVHDNGPDFPDGLVSGHGLQTVFDLLRLSYDENADLSWKNTPKKEIVITIKNID